MAAFGEDPQRLDLRLLQNGAVSLYFQVEVLSRDLEWLRAQHYEVREFDCRRWSDEAAMHRDWATTLSFPDYYGMNLDALNDCVSDIAIGSEGGLVLVLRRIDTLVSQRRELAQQVLDILAVNGRHFLLEGLRLLVLAQSDDPRLSLAPVGATPVSWNPKEWLGKARGV